jgi:hypothetical protein
LAKPHVEYLTLDGVKHELRWDMHAIATVEELLPGVNALNGLTVDVRNIRAVMWAALDAGAAAKGEQAPISFRQIGSKFPDEESMAGALQTFAKLLGLNSPEAKESVNPRKPARARRAKSKRSPSAGGTRSRASTSASVSPSSGA